MKREFEFKFAGNGVMNLGRLRTGKRSPCFTGQVEPRRQLNVVDPGTTDDSYLPPSALFSVPAGFALQDPPTQAVRTRTYAESIRGVWWSEREVRGGEGQAGAMPGGVNGNAKFKGVGEPLLRNPGSQGFEGLWATGRY